MAADGDPNSTPLSSTLPPRRVVLLGASNLTRGISTIVDSARRIWGAPLEVFAALGHGRSYGLTSAVLARKLPGILQCGLWDALSRLPPADTAALVTDVGNDILYGAPVSKILDWVEECVDRLGPTSAPIVLTLPPTATVTALSQWRYSLIRTCVFPSCRLSRNDAFSRAEQLDAGLQELAARRGLRAVRPRVEWYGFDPIHIRRRHWPVAWNEVLSAWCAEIGEANLARGSFARWLYLRSRSPARRTICGIEQRAAQPCGRLRDGTTIAIY
jgi:hypothetical protein